MTGYNGPCKIGKAVCLPGDVVMGTASGVLFIPSHLVRDLIHSAEKAHAKDIFGFAALAQGAYTTADIDTAVWPLNMVEHMLRFIEEDQACGGYRGLDWSVELRAAKGDDEAIAELMKGHLV